MEGDWTTRAACRGVSLNVFFGDSIRDVEHARGFCRVCPVIGECLAMAEALDGSEAYGVYAGLTGHERTLRRLAARRQEAA